MEEMESLKQNLLDTASMSDQMTEDGYAQAAPSGKYSIRALNTLVDSLNRVLPLFSVPLYEKFTEVPESLPGEFVKLLSMVADAAEESESDTFEVSGLTSDSLLMLASGVLRGLEQDKDFKRFLAQPEAKGEAKEMDVMEKPVAKAQPKASSPKDDMDLFASRMR